MTTPPRAARWSRVSSAQQATDDRNGLPAQLEEQSRGIASLHALDTGIAWSLTESGATVHETREYADMLAQAGRTFDVLVVAYVSRLGRKAREALHAAEQIADAGGSVYFVEERIWTRDEEQWTAFARETIEAEAYRRRLSRTMRNSYESRWRRRGIPAARPPMGYAPDWSIDAIAAERVRSIFSDYAAGNISLSGLADRYQLPEERIKEMLRSRTYLGDAGHRVYDPDQPRVARHRRPREWRAGQHQPIIGPELFERVAEMRAVRQRAGGPPTREPSMLQGRLWCVCGTSIRLDGRDGAKQARVRHPSPCDAWGSKERRQARYFTDPLTTALSQIQLSDREINHLIAKARQPRAAVPRPINWTRRRKALRDSYDAGTISESEYIAQGATLRVREAAHELPSTTQTIDEHVLRATLVDFRATIARANEMPYREDFWAQVISRYFDRIEYLGPDHLRPVPSPAGLNALIADTLPAKVVLARPEGFEPPTC